MNPLLASFIGSVLRFLLGFVSGWLIRMGVISSENAEEYIAGAIAALLALAWAFWQKYKTRLFIQAALAAPKDTPEAEVRLMAAQRAR